MTVTPSKGDAMTYINGVLITETDGHPSRKYFQMLSGGTTIVFMA